MSERVEALEAEVATLRARVRDAERNTARTLLRATRLAQVIAALGQDTELDAIVERAALELGELFAADVALLSLGGDDALAIAGHYGMRRRDLPEGTFPLPGLSTSGHPHVRIGPVEEVALPGFLARYGARHVAWARVVVGEESLGHLTLVRRGDTPFERSDADELRAIAHRIALAIDNGRLHRRTSDQLVRLRRLHEITTELAGTMELDMIGRRIAELLVREVPIHACRLSIERHGALQTLSCAGAAGAGDDWEEVALRAADTSVGCVAIAGAPAPGTEAHEMLEHLLGIGALALENALLYDRSREQARRDALTGLLGHQAFQERIEQLIAAGERFCLALFDIDDFKQVNDLHGHVEGDETLRHVTAAMRSAARASDEVYRIGGEEICVVLLATGVDEGVAIAERLRLRVAGRTDGVPVTVSVGVAAHPLHGSERDALLAAADAALYTSKRSGKNRISVAGAGVVGDQRPTDRSVRLTLLHDKDPDTVVHSTHVAILAVDVARRMGVDDARLADLRTAAQLHDIGKIAVPDEILRKPGPLDDEELAVVRIHPLAGASLLRAWGLAVPARFVEEHHERIDGAGYPHGLAGDELALESRILQAADAYMAMTEDRPYRAALSRPEAIAELERGCGTQFDRDVVFALLAVLAAPVAQAA